MEGTHTVTGPPRTWHETKQQQRHVPSAQRRVHGYTTQPNKLHAVVEEGVGRERNTHMAVSVPNTLAPNFFWRTRSAMTHTITGKANKTEHESTHCESWRLNTPHHQVCLSVPNVCWFVSPRPQTKAPAMARGTVGTAAYKAIAKSRAATASAQPVQQASMGVTHVRGSSNSIGSTKTTATPTAAKERTEHVVHCKHFRTNGVAPHQRRECETQRSCYTANKATDRTEYSITTEQNTTQQNGTNQPPHVSHTDAHQRARTRQSRT